MKSHTEYLEFNTQERHEFINLSNKVQEVIDKSKIKEGLVLVNPMHITASVYINDAESGLIQDFQTFLERMFPKNYPYNHNMTGEDNGYAHLWRTFMGREVTVAVTKGKLDFGPWEQIFYAEFDGMRKKRVLVKVIGE